MDIINTMEVLSTLPISELVTEATVKVCYVSPLPNRNGTVISEEIGREIAATLPGAPVVGFFDCDAEDFGGHSRRIIIQDNNFRIENLTRPYGFVALENPWYEMVYEDGQFRKYLMCKTYLWTRQYPEASLIPGKAQSMELDEENSIGYYRENDDVFIYTQATLNALCVLGDSREPCFEGARFLSRYEKQYNNITQELENIIGRRYYVSSGKLVLKEQLPLSRIDTMKNTKTATTNQNQFSLNNSNNDAEPSAVIVPTPAPDNAKVQATPTPVVSVATSTLPVAQVSEGVTQTVSQSVTNPSESAVTEITPVPTPETNEVASQEGVDSIAQDTAVAEGESPEGTTTVAESAESATTEGNVGEGTGESSGAINYEVKCQELTNLINSLNFALNQKNQEIANLNIELNAYKLKSAELDNQEKEKVITSYSKVLTETEMKPVLDKKNEYSAAQLEQDFALIFSRKQLANNGSDVSMQFSVAAIEPNGNVDLPSFMVQAMNYEREHNYSL